MPRKATRYQQASKILEDSLLALQQQGIIPQCLNPTKAEMLQGAQPVCNLKRYPPTPLNRRCTACQKSAAHASVARHYSRNATQYNDLVSIVAEKDSLQRVVLQQANAIQDLSTQLGRWRELFMRAQQHLSLMVAATKPSGAATVAASHLPSAAVVASSHVPTVSDVATTHLPTDFDVVDFFQHLPIDSSTPLLPLTNSSP